MFRVFAAYAATGAILMFNTGPTYGEAIGSYRGDPLFHASPYADEYRRRLFENSFDVVAHAVEDQSVGGRTAWVARAVSAPA
jgi:hypothetical protein